MNTNLLSIIIPSYNEESILNKTIEVVTDLLTANQLNFELIFVDDGSRDRTWEIICEAASSNTHVRGVHFSKNFGKEAAILAGLKYSAGSCCVVMDGDLQHPPETIIEMYRLWEQGYEIVEGVKASRGRESLLHKLAAKTFYRLISSSSGIDMSKASDFKLLDRKVVNEYLKLPERHIFFRALSTWLGYKSTSVEFYVQEREAGSSKWSIKSLIKYAVTNITSFTAAPMQLVSITGSIFLIFALVIAVQSLYRYFSGQALEGFTTVILLLLIIGSILMLSLGIIGYYIAKIYDEIKLRPRYIVSYTEGFPSDEKSDME